MKRSILGIMLVGACVACAAPDPDVSAIRADGVPPPSTDAALPTSSVAPTPNDVVEFEANDAPTFPIQVSELYSNMSEMAISPPSVGAEAAFHALAPTDAGWVAVGSTTPPLERGIAAAWFVSGDGMFGEPVLMPSVYSDASSVARDAVTVGSSTFVVGYEGAGRDAIPVVWRIDDGVYLSTTVLPSEAGRLIGAVTDRILVLADGTLVVVGRGDGPSYSTLAIWWSVDGGTTWGSFVPEPSYSFQSPIVATDGSRVALLLSSVPGDDGLAAFHSAVISFTPQGPQLDSDDYIDPTPGERYWPESLLWDGSVFVAGFTTNSTPLLATSADGVSYQVEPLVLPGNVEQTGSIEGVLMVGGRLKVFVGLDEEILAYERNEDGLVSIPLPYAVHGDLAHLYGRELFATDGVRAAYIATTFDSTTLLTFDGAAWSAREVTEVPDYRNLQRYELHEVVSNGDSKLGILFQSVLEESNRATQMTAGVVWQPPGDDRWSVLGNYDLISAPVAVEEWHGRFLIADMDFDSNVTSLWELDPLARDLTAIATIDGHVQELVGAPSGMLALVTGVDGPADSEQTLWASADGEEWTEVLLPGAATGICTDGESLVAVWMAPDEESDVVGLSIMDGLAPIPLGEPATTNEIWAEVRQVGICGAGERGVLAMHVGFEGALGESSPLSRIVRWEPGPGSEDQVLANVTPIGSAASVVYETIWTGTEWVAVGHSYDLEHSMDATIWRSADGLNWEPGEVIAGGPGHQSARGVLVDGEQLLISGFDVQTATVWLEPLD